MLCFQRHKLSKDWFIPTARKKIEVNGIYGPKVSVLRRKHPYIKLFNVSVYCNLTIIIFYFLNPTHGASCTCCRYMYVLFICIIQNISDLTDTNYFDKLSGHQSHDKFSSKWCSQYRSVYK